MSTRVNAEKLTLKDIETIASENGTAIKFVKNVNLGYIVDLEFNSRRFSDNQLPTNTKGCYMISAIIFGHIVLHLYFGKCENKMGIRNRIVNEIRWSQNEGQEKSPIGFLKGAFILPLSTTYVVSYFEANEPEKVESKILGIFDFPCNVKDNGFFRLEPIWQELYKKKFIIVERSISDASLIAKQISSEYSVELQKNRFKTVTAQQDISQYELVLLNGPYESLAIANIKSLRTYDIITGRYIGNYSDGYLVDENDDYVY